VHPRIGELLVKDGACTEAAVREALKSQVIFGGRVGTNLLELEALSEEALARALGRRHRCPYISGPVRPEPNAVRAVSRELADRLEVVPLNLSDRRITVAALDPSNLAALDEIAFATGRSVRAMVAAEARIWATLRAEYGLFRQLRGIALEPGSGGDPKTVPPAAQRKAGEGPDLMDEAGFDELYVHGRSGQAKEADPVEEIIELTDEVVDPASPLLAIAPVVEPEQGPIAFEEAVAALAGVSERTAIARTVLRYARTRLRRSVLLTVHRGVAHGWVGMGLGLSPGRVQAIRLPVGDPGVIETVIRTRAHYLGPLPRTEANLRLVKALGGGVPKNALVVPILGLGRVVNVIYADGGEGAVVDAGGVGELLILATRIAQSYAALLAKV